ncbi:hydrogenase formation protein HypD [Pseudanabaena sp. PCC 6802]|uniref:hydrogenase formation protein HypD n=1 Tax=Pseudanabaena sp. PCC 6802 TaxID=118173 RepID=UPI000346CFE4|nr:hydrogenase formation protein HypD [Pseudanabaena sp. PCC 6802]
MKFVNEFRDAKIAKQLGREISALATRPWTIMEICGGQTHAIVKYGIDELLPKEISLVHGPGCPVCVTPIEIIDRAIAIASQPNTILCSFGDMLRVPGSAIDLLSVKATGADIRVVYSPLDSLKIAQQNCDRQVVFFAVGFETTAPATAMTLYQAKKLGLRNFSMLVSHVLVPPAMETILSALDCRVQGFLAAGHVCTVMGYNEYAPIAKKYGVPIVVTGFEPLDVLQGIHMCVRQLEMEKAVVENQYARSVHQDGNAKAMQLMNEVFQIVPRRWRGIGEIPASGLGIRDEYAEFDAEKRFSLDSIVRHEIQPKDANLCISGLILQGTKKPHECSAFGIQCTPEHPLGAPMVSSEGACAAYYRYRQHLPNADIQPSWVSNS